MRILIAITRSDTIGGAQTHVLELAKGLSDKGWEVLVIVGGNGNLFKNKLDEIGIRCVAEASIRREPGLHDLVALIQLRKHIQDFNPQIVSLHSVKAGLLGRIATIRTNTNCIYTAHGWSHIRAGGKTSKTAYALIERVLSRISVKIICVCDADAEFAHRKLKIPQSKITRIYNGVQDSPSPAKKTIDNRTIVFGSVARFSHPKDYTTVISALGQCLDLEWRAEFIGDGDQLEEMKAKCKECRIDKNVTFAGFVENIDEYYEKHDYLILSSLSEGMPCSIAEGFAWGVPAIASDVGGIREMVEDGKTGWLISSQSVEEFVAAIRQAIELSSTDKKMLSDNSRRSYENNFSVKMMINKTDNVFRTFLL